MNVTNKRRVCSKVIKCVMRNKEKKSRVELQVSEMIAMGRL